MLDQRMLHDEHLAVQRFPALRLLILDPGDLRDAARVASAVERGVQEYPGELHRPLLIDHTAAHAQDVRVVVAAADLRAERIRAHRRADPADLVGRDGNPDSRAAAKDPLLRLSAGDGVRHLFGEQRVIHRFLAETPEILIGDRMVIQIFPDRLFESKSTVVGS